MRGVITIFLIVLSSTVALKFVENDMLLFWRRSNSEPCEPFTTSKVECNSCICGADKTMYCTKMRCVKKDEERDKLSDENY